MFKVLKESKSYYYVRYQPGFLTDLSVELKIPKSEFIEWRADKHDATDWDKVEYVKPKKKPIKLDDKQQRIINYLVRQVDKKGYILERDIALKGISKAYIRRTIENSNLLSLYGLKRIRATKAIKDELGIASKGYPFIICSDK